MSNCPTCGHRLIMSAEERQAEAKLRNERRRVEALETLTPHMQRVLAAMSPDTMYSVGQLAKLVRKPANSVASVLGGLYYRRKVTRHYNQGRAVWKLA